MWTDERLDDRFNSLDQTLERVDRDIKEVRTDLRELRALMFQLWGTTIIAILGSLITVLIANG